MEKKYGYHTFPTFIDAYTQDFDKLETLEEAKNIAICNTSSWIEKSIGRAMMKNGSLPMIENKIVCGGLRLYDGFEKADAYLIVATNLNAIYNDEEEYEFLLVDTEEKNNMLNLIDVT